MRQSSRWIVTKISSQLFPPYFLHFLLLAPCCSHTDISWFLVFILPLSSILYPGGSRAADLSLFLTSQPVSPLQGSLSDHSKTSTPQRGYTDTYLYMYLHSEFPGKTFSTMSAKRAENSPRISAPRTVPCILFQDLALRSQIQQLINGLWVYPGALPWEMIKWQFIYVVERLQMVTISDSCVLLLMPFNNPLALSVSVSGNGWNAIWQDDGLSLLLHVIKQCRQPRYFSISELK